MKRHEDALFGALENKLVLYGEWCYAAHSIVYKRLPDYFLAFDIYDIAAQRFWNCTRRDALVRGLGLAQRPRVAAGKFDRESVLRLIGNSTLYDGLMEGIYLRQDGPLWLEQGAKIVRAEFIQALTTHWSKQSLVVNRLAVTQVH